MASNPSTHFHDLPAELILTITDHLAPDAFINFAFAHYPLLHRHGLAPALSPPRVRYITSRTRIARHFPLLRLPAELLLEVMLYLNPIDTMRFVLANYQDLARRGIAPGLEGEVVGALEAAVGGDGLEVG